MAAKKQRQASRIATSLRERSERFEAIVDMAGIGVIVLDSAGEVEYVNDMVADITNYSKIEIYRDGLKVFFPSGRSGCSRAWSRT